MPGRDASGRFVKGGGSSGGGGAGVTIKDTDNGYNRTLASIDAIRGLGISVGIQADSPGEVLEKAEANEFGLGNVPPRPFISGWADERRDAVLAEMRTALEKAIKSGSDPEVALARLGELYVGQIQQRIAGGIDPPNAPATVKKKGSSTPLIDSGQLRSSISAKIEK